MAKEPVTAQVPQSAAPPTEIGDMIEDDCNLILCLKTLP